MQQQMLYQSSFLMVSVLLLGQPGVTDCDFQPDFVLQLPLISPLVTLLDSATHQEPRGAATQVLTKLAGYDQLLSLCRVT
jgi:hypothetical protein